MTEQQRREKGVSRRTALKRIGAAGAIAWVTPVVSSLTTPAYAGTIVDSGCTECSGDFCSGQTICGNSGPFGCSCAQKVHGSGCFCYQDDFCSNRTKCQSTSDCPNGETCVHTCCDGSVGSAVCFAPCSTTLRPVAAQGSGPRGGQR